MTVYWNHTGPSATTSQWSLTICRFMAAHIAEDFTNVDILEFPFIVRHRRNSIISTVLDLPDARGESVALLLGDTRQNNRGRIDVPGL